MPQLPFLQTNFTAGEISPRLKGRVDLATFANGAEIIENFVVKPHGGLARRQGTYFMQSIKNPGLANTILVPFQFSAVVAYILEIGNGYCRVFANNSYLNYEFATPWGTNDLPDLKWFQSADVLYVCHYNYMTRKLNRFADTNWTVTQLTMKDGPYQPLIGDDTTLTPNSTAAGTNITFTASTPKFVSTDVGRHLRFRDEKFGKWHWGIIIQYISTTQVVVDWQAVENESNLPNTNVIKQWRLGAISATTGYPFCGTFHEQRLWLGGTNTQPDTMFASMTADFDWYSPTKLNDSDAPVFDNSGLTFTISDDQVNAIRWMSSGQDLMVGTRGAEYAVASGVSKDVITPGSITVKRQSLRGSDGQARCRRIGHAVLFLQTSNYKIYELAYDWNLNGYACNDITILAEHITGPLGVQQVEFQAEPDYLLWTNRLTDGQGVVLTYNREQKIVAWHRQIFGGTNVFIEAMACISNVPSPVGPRNYDQVWFIVRRTINGATTRYIEILEQEYKYDTYGDQNFNFMDCAVRYDGNLAIKNANISVTPASTTGSSVVFTASGGIFTSADVGKVISYPYPKPTSHAVITTFTNSTHVTCNIISNFPNTNPIPATLWGLGIKTLTGLNHLNNETVDILVDGAVHNRKQVLSNSITLDYHGLIIRVGLNYVSKMRTLRPESQQGTIQAAKQRVHQGSIFFHETMGAKWGWDPNKLEQIPFRGQGTTMDRPVEIFSGWKSLVAPSGFDRTAQMYVIQDLPLPCSVLSVRMDLTVGGVK